MNELWNKLNEKPIKIKPLRDIIEESYEDTRNLLGRFSCKRLECLSKYLVNNAITDVNTNLTSVFLIIDKMKI